MIVRKSAIGDRIAGVDELAEPLRSIVHERYPQYLTPPPFGDTSPNETSWTVFRRYLDAQPK